MSESIHTILVTGGAGFIGSAVVRHLLAEREYRVINLDALTYAGNESSLRDVESSGRYVLERADLRDREEVDAVVRRHRPDAILHLAAESHVDRSIDGPLVFVETNVLGTANLLDAATAFWRSLPVDAQAGFRFHHVSTDEVFGDLADTAGAFTEGSPYAPSSPYAASKAGADHLVRAWHRSYGLPTLISNASNNYGPRQYPEKLIPRMILNALAGRPLPVYGDGQQVRDWLYVEDHARALLAVLERGRPGEIYNVSAGNQHHNLDVVRSICEMLESLGASRPQGLERFADLIAFVEDRPGHDRRYAIDSSKTRRELGWAPRESFQDGLQKTVRWYLDNRDWWEALL